MARILFTDNEVLKIMELRMQGKTQRELAELYYCSPNVIGRILRQNGISGNNKHKSKYPVAMIQHDWNAGTDSNEIIKIYRLKDRFVLKNLVRKHREKGWFFRARWRRRVTV